jgi:hypothetical protein
MTVRTTAGSTLAITASQPATYNSAGYEALTNASPTTFVDIGEISDLGEFGRVYNVVKYNTIANRATTKRKGSYDEGTMSLKVGLDNDDAGQTLAKTASESDNDYTFRLTIQDGTKYYFQAQVSSFKITAGNVDSITEAMISLELTSDSSGGGIVQVDPA